MLSCFDSSLHMENNYILYIQTFNILEMLLEKRGFVLLVFVHQT